MLDVHQIMARPGANHFFDFLFLQWPHDLRGNPGDEHSWRHNRSAEHDGTRGDERFLPDYRAIEHHRVHSNESAVLHGAAMEYRAVADRHRLANPCRIRKIGDMDGRVILNIRIAPDANALDIAADHRVEPHAHVFRQFDIADNPRAGGKEDALVDFRNFPVKGIQLARFNGRFNGK